MKEEHWRARRARAARAVVLALLIALGLACRLDAAADFNARHPDNGSWLRGDESSYDDLARAFIAGNGFNWPGRVPLYPMWLGVIYWWSDGSYHAVGRAQAFLVVPFTVLAYLLGRAVFGPLVGLVTAAFASLSPTDIGWGTRLYSEALYAPVLLGVLLAFWRAMRRPSAARFFWAGALLGASNLVRPGLLFFPPFLLLYLPRRFRWRAVTRYGGLYLGASVLVVTPWVIHNYLKYDALLALQASHAILWQGSPEYYHLVRDQGYTYMRVWDEIIYGPGWKALDPNSVAGDRYWTRRAFQSIAREPFVYLRYACEKLFTLWIGDPNADWGDSRIFDWRALRRLGYSRRQATEYMALRVLPLIALLAVVMLRRHTRYLAPLYLVLAYTTLLHAATHAEARLSDPLQPVLVMLVAGAVQRECRRKRDGRGRRGAE